MNSGLNFRVVSEQTISKNGVIRKNYDNIEYKHVFFSEKTIFRATRFGLELFSVLDKKIIQKENGCVKIYYDCNDIEISTPCRLIFDSYNSNQQTFIIEYPEYKISMRLEKLD